MGQWRWPSDAAAGWWPPVGLGLGHPWLAALRGSVVRGCTTLHSVGWPAAGCSGACGTLAAHIHGDSTVAASPLGTSALVRPPLALFLFGSSAVPFPLWLCDSEKKKKVRHIT